MIGFVCDCNLIFFSNQNLFLSHSSVNCIAIILWIIHSAIFNLECNWHLFDRKSVHDFVSCTKYSQKHLLRKFRRRRHQHEFYILKFSLNWLSFYQMSESFYSEAVTRITISRHILRKTTNS